MRLMSAVLLLIAGALITQSCKEKQKDCIFLAPKLIFTHFSESESDTIIIRRFAAGTGFNKPLDTTVISKALITRMTVGKDSVYLNTNNSVFNGQYYLYDWQLVLPGAGRTVNIDNVKATFTKLKEKGAECHSFVSEMTLENKEIKYTTWLPDFYKAYVPR